MAKPDSAGIEYGGEVIVSRPALAALVAEAARASPVECCGLLLGPPGAIDGIRPAENVADDPRRRFEIDPQALVDAHRAARSGGPQIAGYYHSHPVGPAVPSAVDAAEAAGDGRVWAIVGASGVTFWRDGEAGFVPLSYTLADR